MKKEIIDIWYNEEECLELIEEILTDYSSEYSVKVKNKSGDSYTFACPNKRDASSVFWILRLNMSGHPIKPYMSEEK
jgi:hypothetical protein